VNISGTILEQFLRSWGHLCVSWALLGSISAHSRAILGHLRTILGYSRAIWGLSWGCLGLFGDILGNNSVLETSVTKSQCPLIAVQAHFGTQTCWVNLWTNFWTLFGLLLGPFWGSVLGPDRPGKALRSAQEGQRTDAETELDEVSATRALS
jgi:hypothetical protein